MGAPATAEERAHSHDAVPNTGVVHPAQQLINQLSELFGRCVLDSHSTSVHNELELATVAFVLELAAFLAHAIAVDDEDELGQCPNTFGGQQDVYWASWSSFVAIIYLGRSHLHENCRSGPEVLATDSESSSQQSKEQLPCAEVSVFSRLSFDDIARTMLTTLLNLKLERLHQIQSGSNTLPLTANRLLDIEAKGVDAGQMAFDGRSEQHSRLSTGRTILACFLDRAQSATELSKVSDNNQAASLAQLSAQPEGTRHVSAMKRTSLVALPNIQEIDDDEDNEGDALHQATLSITKRDEKMKWVFGDDYQKRQISQPSTSKRKQSRPSSMSSVNSCSTSTSSRGGNGISIHRRVLSSSSSTTPLIEPPSPRTTETPSTSHHKIFHKRGKSNGTALPPTLDPKSKSGSGNQERQQPFSDLLPKQSTSRPTRASESDIGRQVAAPLTINVLSANSRRDLIRKSRKLEQVLGSVVTEEAVKEVLQTRADTERRPSMLLVRSRSFPPHSPTPSLASFEQQSSEAGDIELGMVRRTSRSRSSPSSPSESPMGQSPVDRWFPRNSSSIPNASSFSALGGTLEMQREERRRKLAKLQRMLGERVPVEVALNDMPGRSVISGDHHHVATGIGGRLRGALGLARKHPESTSAAQAPETLIQVDASSGSEPRGSRDLAASRVQKPVNSMAKARKLENVFGDLPPKALYAMPSYTPQSARRTSLSTTRTRSSSMRTIDTFRSSVASLQILAESDPAALSAIVETYAVNDCGSRAIVKGQAHTNQHVGLDPNFSFGRAAGSGAGDAPVALEVDPLDDQISTSTLPTADATSSIEQRSASSRPLSQRYSATEATKRATKLSQFFGTTRGQVWAVLLDDLEQAVRDEVDLDQDEKTELLTSLEKLRHSTMNDRGGGEQ
ncbi:hypothetical protein OIO90_006536 [Microbotryomycetes sp. JL221]|nr:hypothetical protein OIO90_006536 [Microbotryomycetes sp. JL221]